MTPVQTVGQAETSAVETDSDSLTALGKIYDRRFFTQYGSANAEYLRSCALIAAEIARRFAPQSLVDWGCGSGLYLAEFLRLGVRAVGVDGSPCPADLRPAEVKIVQADLREKTGEELRKQITPQPYDLSLCLDVLEHIEARDSQQVLDNITRDTELLLMSCAPPGQGGHHHVNEQPRRYWIQRMDDMGWQYQRRETGQLEHSFLDMGELRPLTWMYHNICVYRRK